MEPSSSNRPSPAEPDSRASDQRGDSPQSLASPENRASASTAATSDEAAAAPGGTLRRRLPRGRWLAGGALAIAAAAVVAIVLLGADSPHRAGADTGVPAGDTTTTVTRRTLSEGSTVDGTLGYGSKAEIYDRLAGTFTWLPAVGSVIARGAPLFRINDEPIVLMYGSVPAYRVLKQGISDGADVAELNTNLIDLGFDPYGAIADGGSFGEATATAVRRWQKAEGLRQTGEVELGRVVFAPSARRVTELHVALGQDPPGEEPAATTPRSTTPAATTASFTTPTSTTPTSTTPTSTTPTSTTPTSTTPSSTKPSSTKPSRKSHSHKPGHKSPGHKSPNHKSPHKPSSTKPSSGGSSKQPAKEPTKAASNEPAKESGEKTGASSGAGEAVLATTSTRQTVTLAVKAEQQQLARVGETVPVTLPGGQIRHGRISHVGTVASEPKSEEKGGGSGSEGGESATISVTVALEHPVAHLDQAPVSVELVHSVRHDVLTVPATALIATAAGGYAVEALEGVRRVTLAVTPGMFAGGYVQVEGAGLREGLIVLESR